MDHQNGPHQRVTITEPIVDLTFNDSDSTKAGAYDSTQGFQQEAASFAGESEDDIVQEYTRCNSCCGRCMPRCCCQWWFDLWPCCRPVGSRIPREDPMNPKTNIRLLFFTLCGIIAGLVGGFIVRFTPFPCFMLYLPRIFCA